MQLEPVIFDLDGVLIDSVRAITGCINAALVEHDLPPQPTDSLKRFIGPPLTQSFGELTGEDEDSPVVASCIATYRAYYAPASLRDTTVVPGIPAALSALAAVRELAVATSKALAFADPLLAAVGLKDSFVAIAGPELDTTHETKAETIATALAALGSPETAVMVGDRSFDIVGAQANRLPSIAVTWGIGDRPEFAAAGANLIIDSPEQLPAAVASVLAAARGQ